MNIFKEIKKLQSKSEKKKGSIHPFTVVKKEGGSRLKKYILFLLFTTFVLYGFIFYSEFFQKKTNEKKTVKKYNSYQSINISDISNSVEKTVEVSLSNIKFPEKEKSEDLFQKALEKYRKNNYTEALYYINILLSREYYIPAIILKAKIFDKEGLHDRARTILEEAYYKNPDDKDILLALGEIYEKEGAYIIAKEMYRQLSNNGFLIGTYKLANIYEKLGEKEKALKFYKKILKNPNIPPDMKKEVEKKILILGK